MFSPDYFLPVLFLCIVLVICENILVVIGSFCVIVESKNSLS